MRLHRSRTATRTPLDNVRGRALRRLATTMLVLLGSLGIWSVMTLGPAAPAFGDGPAPCSVGGPPFPSAGFCATYSGANTWYGSYGPGFPTAQGWGFCADRPASGGDYPAPLYQYQPGPAPLGASTTNAGALGFALSEAQVLGWWNGQPGQFTTDQAAAAGKLLYDAVIWGSSVPSMDPGMLAAYNALNSWYVQAIGSSGPPELTLSLLGGDASFTTQGTLDIEMKFPGSNRPASGVPIDLNIVGATFNSVGGPQSITVATDGAGRADVPVLASSPGPVAISASLVGGTGHTGLEFLSPTTDDLRAQGLVGFFAPSPLSVTTHLESLPNTGTLSIRKLGDDPAYYPVTGAVFEVLSGSKIEATLTTRDGGTTPTSPPLPAGPYVVHEQTAPVGYRVAPDQVATIVAGSNTEVSFSGPEQDHVIPATLTISKNDAATGRPLSGAAFEIIYDATNDGSFNEDLGSCATNAQGLCSPRGNDGPGGLLPGRYKVTETAAPAGYGLPTPAFQVVDLVAGEAGNITFGDPKLVQAVFQKTASGNVNLNELSLAGAVFLVTSGSLEGPSVTECTTNSTGLCVTSTSLVSGQRYCWSELAPPPGLAGGAKGCFIAVDGQANQPITVADAGTFVAIEVKKLDAANRAVGLPGAVFDLYRVPNTPIPSVLSPTHPFPITPDVLVGSVTTDKNGVGVFALQLPGFAYCAVELDPPSNYQADTTQQCTGVLTGTTQVPAPITALTFADSEQTVSVTVFKYNSLSPSTVISGATYDLYVEGSPPPSGAPTPVPTNAVSEPDDTWYARGTTDAGGRLPFSVPAGYAWCVREVHAPVNYVLDPVLHCSGVITKGTTSASSTIAIPETLATVHLSAYKYNSRHPDTVIPHATYEVVAKNAQPPGSPLKAPAGSIVPQGDTFWAEGTTNINGVLTFTIPAGFRWCLHELVTPPAYLPDPAFHCTALLTADSTSASTTVAIPEVPIAGGLAFTGFPTLALVDIGGIAVIVGGLTLALSRPRRHWH